jgi:hypothetical protein
MSTSSSKRSSITLDIVMQVPSEPAEYGSVVIKRCVQLSGGFNGR